MNKRKWSDRLQLLNGGRCHYLDFLRNLTPQIALLSMAFLIGIQLDITRIDFNNTLPTVLFSIILGSAILAFYANATLFYERCFADDWKTLCLAHDQLMTAQGVIGLRRRLVRLQTIWHCRVVELLEVMIACVFLQIIFAYEIAISLKAAEGMWRASQHAG